jgi:hypothetical protein
MLARFTWGEYGFNSGHFLTLIQEQALPVKIILACDPYVNGRALFREMMDYSTILDSASAFLDHVRGSGITSRLFGYIIHSHRYSSTKPTSQFWDIQCSIVRQLHITHLLAIVVAFVHPNHNGCSLSTAFMKRLSANRLMIMDTSIAYPDYCDLVTGSCRLIVAVNSNTEQACQAFVLKTPPSVHRNPLHALSGPHSIGPSMQSRTLMGTHCLTSTQ